VRRHKLPGLDGQLTTSMCEQRFGSLFPFSRAIQAYPEINFIQFECVAPDKISSSLQSGCASYESDLFTSSRFFRFFFVISPAYRKPINARVLKPLTYLFPCFPLLIPPFCRSPSRFELIQVQNIKHNGYNCEWNYLFYCAPQGEAALTCP
jgi:hypothetical protein